jgi:hypothetical protein
VCPQIYDEAEPFIDALNQRKQHETSWDEVIPKQMKSFEGALIRRADVASEV